MLLSFFIVIVHPNDPWTKKVKSLENTIKRAYAIIENDNDKSLNCVIVSKHINFSIIAICKKVHYLSHRQIKPAELKTSYHAIYHDKKILAKS